MQDARLVTGQARENTPHITQGRSFTKDLERDRMWLKSRCHPRECKSVRKGQRDDKGHARSSLRCGYSTIFQ